MQSGLLWLHRTHASNLAQPGTGEVSFLYFIYWLKVKSIKFQCL